MKSHVRMLMMALDARYRKGLALITPGAKQAISELGLLYFIVIAAIYLFPGNEFLGTSGSALFWIPVILGSAQYGRNAGILCAVASTILSRATGLYHPAGSADFYERFLFFARDPALWLFSSIVLAQIHERQINRWNELRQSHEKLELERQGIAEYCIKLEEQFRSLERKIATGQTVNALVSSVLAVRNSTPEGLGPVFRKLAIRLLGPCGYAVYLGGRGEAREWLTVGDKGKPHWQPGSVKRVLEAIALERRLLSALDGPGPLLNSCLYAAPIFNRHNGTLLGTLLIRDMEPDAIGEQTGAAVTLLAEELSLAHARGVADLAGAQAVHQRAS